MRRPSRRDLARAAGWQAPTLEEMIARLPSEAALVAGFPTEADIAACMPTEADYLAMIPTEADIAQLRLFAHDPPPKRSRPGAGNAEAEVSKKVDATEPTLSLDDAQARGGGE